MSHDHGYGATEPNGGYGPGPWGAIKHAQDHLGGIPVLLACTLVFATTDSSWGRFFLAVAFAITLVGDITLRSVRKERRAEARHPDR